MLLLIGFDWIRGYCMMRKTLNSVAQLLSWNSLLAHYFRQFLFGIDPLASMIIEKKNTQEDLLKQWNWCRKEFGMHYVSDMDDYAGRQQYFPINSTAL